MGGHLSKPAAVAPRGNNVAPSTSPTAAAITTSVVASGNAAPPKNLIAPHYNESPPQRMLQETRNNFKSTPSLLQEIPRKNSGQETALQRRLHRAHSTIAMSADKKASPLTSLTQEDLELPIPPPRHRSPLRQSGAESRLPLDRKSPQRRVRKKKPVTIGLDVLLRDERARMGYFKYLRAVAYMDKIDDEGGQVQIQIQTEVPVADDRRSNQMKRTGAKTVDYREDCALFWLEITDLLKIPSSTTAGGVSSFQMGLMDDLFDVYVNKGAIRELPMVSPSERESLAQYLADRNAERALLMFKMLLLDVLDVVTANFDEYVREPGPLGYTLSTKSESTGNVLAQLTKRLGGGGANDGDRRAHLHHILSTPALCRMFREFLETRNSVENFLFIIDALNFEDLVNTFKHGIAAIQAAAEQVNPLHKASETPQLPPTESHQDYCVREAHKIFTKYVRYGSKAEVCLSTTVKDQLLERLAEYPLSADIFSDAVLLCSAELVQSHLDAFYRTVAYLSYQAATAEQPMKKQLNGRIMDTSPSVLDSHAPTADGATTDPTNVASIAVSTPRGPVGAGNRQNQLGLADILDGAGVHVFRDFLREQGVENTLLFYKDVCEFQRLPHSQRQYIQMRARRIFDKYVRRGGRLELELPVETRRDILWKLAAPSEATFSDAQRLVLRQWESRELSKFRESPLYQEMLDQIAASPAAPPPAISHDGEEQTPTANSSSGGHVDVAKLSLREFLELEQLRKYFRRFLEREQCANELYFYFEIATFQQFPTSDYLTRQAKKLFNRFCDPQSREFVPFASSSVHRDLQSSLTNPSPAMFNKAQEEILNFFATTLFPKFQQSEIYRGIRMTPQQLRTERLAAMGGGSNRKLAGAKNAVRRPSGPNAVVALNNEAEEAALDGALTEGEVTVTMILENEETRAIFLFFSEEIFCTESIYFWMDCNEFKDIPHRNYLKLRAQKIYRKYICGRAKLQVNLESALIRVIESNLDNPTRTLFVPAQRSITKMLERDTLPKFRRSKHFQPCYQLLLAAK